MPEKLHEYCICGVLIMADNIIFGGDVLMKIYLILNFLIMTFQFNAYAAQDDYVVKLKHKDFVVTNKSQAYEYLNSELAEYIEPDYEVKLFGYPSDELYSEQQKMVNAEVAWSLETYGNGVKIAVIDSGCYIHDDIRGNLIEGYNYIDNNVNTSDNIGHGTHVAGIIAAGMDNGGIVGFAPKANIIPLKCFDPGDSATVSRIARAIYDAVDVYNCKVINMSLGTKDNSETLKNAVNYACEKGVVLVASVGNDGASQKYYPAAYDNVIGVGSVDENKEKSLFSQYNDSVFVVAPGENIKSLWANNGYNSLGGTSQAASLVTGLAAIALSCNKDITPEYIKDLLIGTSDDLGTAGYDTFFGYGLVNTENFIEKLLENSEYYISPVNICDDVKKVTVFNMAAAEQSVFLCQGQYRDKHLIDFHSEEFILNSFDSFNIIFMTPEETDTETKFFVMSDFSRLIPLSNVRKVK